MHGTLFSFNYAWCIKNVSRWQAWLSPLSEKWRSRRFSQKKFPNIIGAFAEAFQNAYNTGAASCKYHLTPSSEWLRFGWHGNCGRRCHPWWQTYYHYCLVFDCSIFWCVLPLCFTPVDYAAEYYAHCKQCTSNAPYPDIWNAELSSHIPSECSTVCMRLKYAIISCSTIKYSAFLSLCNAM